MFRLTLIGTVALVALALAACNRSSDSMTSNGAYTGGEGIRFDQNGNKTYDPTIGNHSRAGYADGDRGGYPGNQYGNDRNSRESQRESRADHPWNDRDVVMVSESELPAAARTCMFREAGGTTLSETGHGMWDGKPAYCCKMMKNGHPCRCITDADGNLITMRRLD